ncbi:MAG: hypothetical protein L3J70_09455, partial [Gammaproteobacteria bacterium]|nr:hypothetical protein [Gammaproteobacteria bacterium]
FGDATPAEIYGVKQGLTESNVNKEEEEIRDYLVVESSVGNTPKNTSTEHSLIHNKIISIVK